MSRSPKRLFALAGLPALAVLAVGHGLLSTSPRAQPAPAAPPSAATSPGHFGPGRPATPEEIAGWNIAIRPDGRNLPVGRGSVKDGETLYGERCASCHGEFGEGKDRWPVLAGGGGTLKSHDPVKTIGSYWPYASTLMDYIRRSMPYGNAQSLTPDELYAVTAYVLSLNDVIKDDDFVLSNENFNTIKLSNEVGFFDDDREVSEKRFWKGEPCMSSCLPGTAEITGRARVVDVTPESGKGPKVD